MLRLPAQELPLQRMAAMVKTILVPLTGDATDDAALETAFLIGRRLGAHLACLHVAPSWREYAAHFAAEGVANPRSSAELISTIQEERKAIAWRAQRHFAELCRRWNVPVVESPQAHGVSVGRKVASGDGVETIIAEARVHDLLVLGRMQDTGLLGALIVSAGRPVVLAPKQALESLVSTIAVAWKNSPEAARALTAAMPLLAKADKILVFAVDEGRGRDATIGSAECIAQYLHWHGLSADAHYVVPDECSVVDAIAQAALNNRADLLVMGGYGHSRVRELVLGGVTRDVLNDCPLP
jgi:nucleotide-binding universal stress UspA family protein